MNLHPKTNHKGLVSIQEDPWVLGQATGIWTHLTHHGPDSGEATTFPLIVFSAALRRGYIQMALFLRTPKLESRNYLETVPIGVPRLWEFITPDCRVGSRQGLNQSCSPCRDFPNDGSHSQIGPFFCPYFGLQMSEWPMQGDFRYLRFKTFPNDTKNTSMRGVLGLVVEL